MVRKDGVHYHIETEGDGTPVLLLHGFTGDSSTWKNLLPFLQGCKTISVDLLGHGKTDSPADPDRYRIEKAVEDIKDLLDSLQADKVNLLGYSMGGRLAIAFAVTYPSRVASLILESSSPGLKTEQERKQRAEYDGRLAERILTEGMTNFVDYWERIPLFASQRSLPDALQAEIRENRLSQNPVGLANSLKGMGTGTQPGYWQELSSLPMEMLFIVGELDNKFCKIAEEMQKTVKMAAIEKVSGCGHALHVEEPEKFGTIVRKFLKNT
ncbi:2-succinyl-6-hydroxy-2,4-cyclohexadiene-1-carboxylate synthase [Bacillus sp. AK031]